MNIFKTFALACALIISAQGIAMASPATPADVAAFDFVGNFTSYSGPPEFADQEDTVLGLELFPGAGYAFNMTVVVENWAEVASTPGIQHIDLTLPSIDVLANSPIGVVDTPDFPNLDESVGMTTGTGTLTVVNGAPTTIEYLLDREALSAFDEFFTDRGFVNFGLEEVSIWGGGFSYVDDYLIAEEFGLEVEGKETLEYWVLGNAENSSLRGPDYLPYGQGHVISTTVVPVPAAVWLFGTALAGFAGVAKRKRV
ncbi:MAG: VPLPA-CTERM sorting domain-containing protein [Pseudomonadota bacterium]